MTSPNKGQFVYVTYIASTQEKVFSALMDPEMTKDYWGRSRTVCDWKQGSRFEHRDYDNEKQVDVVGKVLEIDPPKRLVMSWAWPQNEGDAEKTSRVTFLVEKFMSSVRLTVTHEDLELKALQSASMGWPAILSSLKSLLETGKPLPETTRRWQG